MTEQQKDQSLEDLADLLTTARGRAEEGEYGEALLALRDAKALYPRNIYVLAFERQVEQLTELSSAGTLGPDEKVDILESIPGIVERALEGSGVQALPAAPAPDPSAVERARAERVAAHEWLKNQYFQHAHEYVKKGEYDHALAEIRRVFIIDPENTIAKDFEAQIGELSRIRKESVAVPPTSPRTAAKRPPQAAAPAADVPKPDTTATAAPAPSAAPRPGRKKLSPVSIILLFVALALLAFATVYLVRKLESPPPPPQPRSSIPTPQRELYTPEQAAPRADSTQAQPDTLSGE